MNPEIQKQLELKAKRDILKLLPGTKQKLEENLHKPVDTELNELIQQGLVLKGKNDYHLTKKGKALADSPATAVILTIVTAAAAIGGIALKMYHIEKTATFWTMYAAAMAVLVILTAIFAYKHLKNAQITKEVWQKQ